MLIDTHCHLNDAKFDNDIKKVITNAKKAGIKKFIVPGYDYVSSEKTLKLSKDFPGIIFPAVGIHPYEAQYVNSSEILSGMLNKVLNQIIAIGECGLDFKQYKGHDAIGKKDNQKRLFEDHCLFALKYNLPVIIHTREAYSDLFDVLDGLPSMPTGVLHCFSGGLQDLRMAFERKLMIGLDCNITYSKHLQSILPEIDLTKLLLETDSPYLPPEGHRGQRNEPKLMTHSVSYISRILNKSPSEISELTTQNVYELFTLLK